MRNSLIAVGAFLALFAVGYIFLAPALGPQFSAIVAVTIKTPTTTTPTPIVPVVPIKVSAPTSTLGAMESAILTATTSQAVITAAATYGYIAVSTSTSGGVPYIIVEQTSTAKTVVGYFIGPQY